MTNVIDNPPVRVPSVLVAGDTLKVAAVALAADYPASDSWSMKWTFVPAKGGTPVEVTATGGSASWDVLVAANVTAAWGKGLWNWVARATKSSQTITVDQGSFEVRPDPAATNVDQRSHFQRTLDLIEATIEGRATGADLEHQFEDGRRIKYMTHAELLQMRDAYAAKVRAERQSASGKGPARLLARL